MPSAVRQDKRHPDSSALHALHWRASTAGAHDAHMWGSSCFALRCRPHALRTRRSGYAPPLTAAHKP